MLTAEEKMELEVLRKHGAGIRELARVTGWSRNTVRRYLREGDAAAVRKAAPKRAEKLDRFKGYIIDRGANAAFNHNSLPYEPTIKRGRFNGPERAERHPFPPTPRTPPAP